MNLPRLRELLKAWQDGSIRDAELAEIRDALPDVLDAAEQQDALAKLRAALRFQIKLDAERIRADELHSDRAKIAAVVAGKTDDVSWLGPNPAKSFRVLPGRWFDA